MKTRLINNWVTTIIGVIILGFVLWTIYSGKQTAEEMAGYLAVALLFIRSKDSIIGLPPKE